MDKIRIKQLQNGHRDAARKSAHPIWRVHRGDQGVTIVRDQPESAERQEQDENKLEVSAADWDYYDKVLQQNRQRQQYIENQKRKIQDVEQGKPGAPAGEDPIKINPQRITVDEYNRREKERFEGDKRKWQEEKATTGREPSWTPTPPRPVPGQQAKEPAAQTHSDAQQQKRKLEQDKAKRPVKKAPPTTPTTPKQQTEKKRYDEAQAKAQAEEAAKAKADPNPDNDPALGPENFKPPADDPSQPAEPGGGIGGWLGKQWRNLTAPDHDLAAADEILKKMPDRRTLKAWAIAYLPKPDNIDQLVNEFLSKAGRSDIADTQQLSTLRERYKNYASTVHTHRLRYVEYLLDEMYRQKSRIKRAEYYGRFQRWVSRQKLNDVVKVAIFQALTFLTENSKRELGRSQQNPSAPQDSTEPMGEPDPDDLTDKTAFERLAAISNPFQAAQDLTDIMYYLRILQGYNVDINDQNKVMQAISRRGPQLQQVLQRVIQAHGSWAEVVNTYKWIDQIASEQGISMQEATQEVTPAQQTPATQALAPTRTPTVPKPTSAPADVGMESLPEEPIVDRIKGFVRVMPHLSDSAVQKLQQEVKQLDVEAPQLFDEIKAIDGEIQRRTIINHRAIDEYIAQHPEASITKREDPSDPMHPYLLQPTATQGVVYRLYPYMGEPPGEMRDVSPEDKQVWPQIYEQLKAQNLLPERPPAAAPTKAQPPKRPVSIMEGAPPPVAIPHSHEEMQQQLRDKEPGGQVIDEADRKLHPEKYDRPPEQSQIPSAPLTPEPEKLMQQQLQPSTPTEELEDSPPEPVDEGMNDISDDEISDMMQEIDQGQAQPTTAPQPTMPTPAPVQSPATPVPGPEQKPPRPRQQLQIEKEYGVDLGEKPKTTPAFVPPDQIVTVGNEDIQQYSKGPGNTYMGAGDMGGFLTMPDGRQLDAGNHLLIPSKDTPGTFVEPTIETHGSYMERRVQPFIGMGVINNALIPTIKSFWLKRPPLDENNEPKFTTTKQIDREAFRVAKGFITGYAPSPDGSVNNTWIRVYHPFIDEEHGGTTIWAPLSAYQEDRDRTVISLPDKVFEHPHFGKPGYPGYKKESQQIQQAPPMQSEAPAGTQPQNPLMPQQQSGVTMADSGTMQAPTVTTTDANKGTANQMANQVSNNGQMPQPDVQSTGQQPLQTDSAMPGATPTDPNHTLTLKAPTGQEMKVKLAEYGMDMVTDR